MNDFKNNTFLGKGWAFPPKFDFETKSPRMVYAEEDVKESLIILLSTMKNERVMFPDYGCDLVKMIFEEIDNTLHYYIIDLVKNAIIINEPRVDVENIDLKIETEAILITIDYTIRDTNSRHNLVYPFYINQGTNIDIHDKIY
jgi:phage baseplate assembly protein W